MTDQEFITALESVSLALAGWAERRMEDGWTQDQICQLLKSAIAAVEAAKAWRDA